MNTKLLVLSVVVLGGLAILATGPTFADTAGNDALTLDVVQDDDANVTVTVTDDGEAVTGADVTVSADEGETYAGDGDYVTDENGTVGLPAPETTVNVTVTASTDDRSASTRVTLEPASAFEDTLSIGVQQGPGVTVSVTENASPVENATVSIEADDWTVDDSTTDGDGIATFDRPEETVNATIHATTENASGTTNVTIQGWNGEGPEETPRGQRIAAIVQSLFNADGPLGQLLSAFDVVGSSGNSAGPPDQAGPPSDDGERGPPAHAGPDSDNQGPPEHAGPDHDDEEETEDEDEDGEADEDDDAESDDNERGPPDHAGNF